MAVDRLSPTSEADAAELGRRAAALKWYHVLELAPGVETAGMFDLRSHVPRYGLPDDLTGMRVLDVGTFDGFWAFELERRGAAVVALDIDNTHDMDWPPRLRPEENRARGETFRLAHAAYGSSVERVGCSIYDATPEQLGMFDIVFCGSILIHLRDPMLALMRMAALCGDRLIACEEYSRRLQLLPGASGAEFRGNTPWMTWWLPNVRTWLEMITCAGFESVEQRGRFNMDFRARRGGVPHVVIHARAPQANSSR